MVVDAPKTNERQADRTEFGRRAWDQDHGLRLFTQRASMPDLVESTMYTPPATEMSDTTVGFGLTSRGLANAANTGAHANR
ncbi:hypothetical protein GN244_ATG04536 [Phytophthora infestans]|uniref:Uncharacterized protein n=1 Tax=Phytophthora infestans TaxID=4787 RepID=A0A833S926_PHYIN|nr:hypothetical protein GN244_ATG04535 [Phytophthora infestans]KAF4043062.1 hypothetical protein GN244_ATG04536 [Phytophthora infestans]KAF4135916.1 hypothetical protein GN958_ATG14902 [Phytophthora infestans]KAF4135919.1 hypothetical protein GN958_ATG14905 [Phytophthora infestans]